MTIVNSGEAVIFTWEILHAKSSEQAHTSVILEELA